MKKLHIILLIFLVNMYQKNQLSDEADLIKAVILGSVGVASLFMVGLFTYGAYDDYYWEHKAPAEQAIKHYELFLVSKNFKDPKMQAQLKRKLEAVKERLARERKEQNEGVSKKKEGILEGANPERQPLSKKFLLEGTKNESEYFLVQTAEGKTQSRDYKNHADSNTKTSFQNVIHNVRSSHPLMTSWKQVMIKIPKTKIDNFFSMQSQSTHDNRPYHPGYDDNNWQ